MKLANQAKIALSEPNFKILRLDIFIILVGFYRCYFSKGAYFIQLVITLLGKVLMIIIGAFSGIPLTHPF